MIDEAKQNLGIVIKNIIPIQLSEEDKLVDDWEVIE